MRVGQVFALVAWDLEPFQPAAPTVHWFRKLIRVTNLGYCLTIIVAVGTATLLHHSSGVSNEFFAIRTLSLSEDVIVNAIVLLAMIGCKWSRSFYSTFLRELLAQAKTLHACQIPIDFRHIETIVDKLLVGALVYFAIVALVDWLFIFDPSCTFLCHTVLHLLPNVIHLLALYQYAVLQLIVCCCYRAIYSMLARYCDQSRPKPCDCGDDLLEVLRKVHLQLGGLAGQVVGRFGPLIVCTVLSSFVVLNLELFNVYKATGTGGKHAWSVGEGFKLVHTLLWIGLHGAKILLVLYPAHRGRIECERTGPALYEIASEASGTTNRALLKFAGQLLLLHGKGHHCKACGLITLDLTLISKVAMVLELLSNKQLFRKEFLHSSYRLLRVCQIVGTVPWEVTLFASDSKPLTSWRVWLLRSCNALYSLGLALAVMSATVLQHVEFDRHMPFMTRMLYISEYIMENGVVLLVLIGCHYQRHCYQHYCDQLLTVALELSLCGGTVDFHRIETIFNRMLACVTMFFAGVLMVDFLYNDRLFWNFVRSSAIYTLSNVINVLGLLQYAYVLYVVYFCYYDTNKLLKSYTRHLHARDGTGRYHVRRVANETVLPAGALYDYAHLIDLLRRTHLRLAQLMEQVNGCFGVLIVSTTTASFVVLSLQFFAIYQATTVRPWTIIDTYLLVYTVMWIVLHAAKVLLILYPCHLVQRERDRTGPLLYRFDPVVQDSALNNALAKFSSQLLHIQGPQTACGVINLEMTLISTMVGALTTYLVILIQFETAVTQGYSAGGNNGSSSSFTGANGHGNGSTA
uniref:Gustatory receptor n=1 Tax=Anopheles christyi TaxID=43041 RepID=A0A182K6S5_9DIPT